MFQRVFGAWFTVLIATLGVVGPMSVAIAQRSTPVQLLHPSGAEGDEFGEAVSVSGDTMVVRAGSDDVGANVDQGSVLVYRWTASGWAFEAQLTASDGAAGDLFATSVAISGDTVVMGVPFDDVGVNLNQGSAYVFTRSGTTWTQQAQLTASDGRSFDNFGYSIAISGDTVIVGATDDDSSRGSAYVFTRSGTTWTEQAKLLASDGAAFDQFGISVSISGDTAVVGAWLDNVGATVDQGSAYVFTRMGTIWTQQAHLIESVISSTSDGFGASVSVSGDTVIVGAFQTDFGGNVNSGSASVFTRTGTNWSFESRLVASDGRAGDVFGVSVSIFGDTAVVGAVGDDVGGNADQGSAYVFRRAGSTWSQEVKLTAPDGAEGDNFGLAVSISSDTVVAGVHKDDVNANGSQGSAWVFSRIGSTWIGPDLRTIASDGAASDGFGTSVAISGDTAVVGVDQDDTGSFTDRGSAYIFVRRDSAWVEQAKLLAADGNSFDRFGNSVSISGNIAVVGAVGDDSIFSVDQGSAYVFVRSGSAWSQQAKLIASDGNGMDRFGESVSIFGDTIVVGASGDEADTGSAYAFIRNGSLWSQQIKFTVSEGSVGDKFGASIAMSGETVVIGAPADQVGANASQGSAYVFSRSGLAWTLQARLNASDGAAGDEFGRSVAISGDTVVAGAASDDEARGSVGVFVRTGSTWSQQAKLIASDRDRFDEFGCSVAVSGDTVVVGAFFDDVSGLANRGSIYVFTRRGTVWMQQAMLAASDGTAGDLLGSSVAISGDVVVGGAAGDDNSRGSAWMFDVVANDLPVAHNDVTDRSYSTLGAAMLPAGSGQQITATEGAWRTAGSLNTLGRSLSLQGADDIRTPSSTTLDLGGASELVAGPGGVIEFFGQLRVSSNASANIVADAFRLGSRGILTARVNSSVVISAPTTELDGQTRLEQGSSLTVSGSVTAIGPTTANLNASLMAGGTFTNIDTFTITGGTISSPLFWNRAQANIFGSSAVFGSYSNEAGGVTTIRSGTLFVFGGLTNNGTIVGTICSNCLGGAPNLEVGGTLSLGPAANLTMPFDGSLVHVGGSFDCAINSNERYHMSLATLQLEGTGAEQALEVMSTDIGADVQGLDRTLAGQYPIGTLHIGPSPSAVRLVDTHDNDGLGQGSCEAIYVDTLQIDAGSRLINPSCRIYCNTLINDGRIDVPSNVISLVVPSCPADYNGDGGVDGDDVIAFFGDWDNGNIAADITRDGGVDGDDVIEFFARWDAGC